MKKKIQVKFFIVGIMLSISCSSDDKVAIPPAEDNLSINAQVDEYPVAGDEVATVNSKLTGELIFTLLGVSVDNALEINSESGVLTVVNAFAYDYERSAEITGDVVVSNGSETELWSLIVAIRNIDDIEYWLTDSKIAYQSANSGNWIPVTEDEYLELSLQMSGISKSGTTDILYEQGLSAGIYETYSSATVANDLSSLPEDSYVFAIKYLAIGNQIAGNKVKVSDSSVNEGFTDLGNALPSHNEGQHYFVLKGAGKSTTTSRGFLGIYSQNGLSYDVEGNAQGTHFFGEGDTNMLDDESNSVQRVCIYQGLSTPIKQWD
ncbi:cadherin repeat domain-containing protein [Maribacter halichondriae]|uniref:cadherin repeat domain-containing protein n=1 Tax=Maribacter halichondriae TaxID=2980554 RepID=UPI0023582EDD|nr:cadherin repeat domain-containing protein [Maribacter sp. Hal144]